MSRGISHLAIALLLMAAIDRSASHLHAETEINLANALDFAGFDLIGQHNPLSGGIDFLAATEFQGAPFDFGAWDLSLQGPLSLQVSTGGRLVNQFDLSLTTAVSGRSAASPLSYAFTYDVGPQSAEVTGTVLADVDFSINQFGFYDLGVTYSSRQQATTDGRFSNDTSTDDFDLGPIRVSGNIYADALAILTDPIFDRLGAPNVFTSFSGNTVLNDLLLGSTADPTELLASVSGLDPAGSSVFRAVGHGEGGIPGLPGFSPGQAKKGGGAVPEPAVLVLMLLGLPAILAYPRRRRSRKV